MQIKIEKLEGHKSIEEFLIEPSIDFATQLFNISKRKIFVFIDKNIYDNLPKETCEQIDEVDFEDTISQDGEPPKVTLEEILEKKVVFVKYINKNFVNELISLRYKFTGEKINLLI
jgi:hypothetical protein